ncbi:unnamed protein product [Fraxinus pennsylvanica]|uniref:GH10 domain-containing protein n=1 Tax=Fraxinus pennsylvanica TaxID=56036 RepID=A0AAD1YKM3_9LAMI|nr:unnamed protein product [Fraxinus pennsylvanica]
MYCKISSRITSLYDEPFFSLLHQKSKPIRRNQETVAILVLAFTLRSVLVFPSSSEYDSQSTGSVCDGDRNIILNPRFDNALCNWVGRGCMIALYDSMADGEVLPMSGKHFASTEDLTEPWNGIQQEITGRVQRKLAYEFASVVRIYGYNITISDITAKVWVQAPDLREHYIKIASVKATDEDWVQLQGKFLLNCSPARVIICLVGPPRGTDILLDNLVVKHAPKVPPSLPTIIENPALGVNIIANSNLSNDTSGWFAHGNCTLTIGNGTPVNLPPMARDSLGIQKPLSGRYVLVTNRTKTWMGPAQMITDKLKLYLTYQVSAWVRIGSRATRPQNIRVTLKVDDLQWVNCGKVEVTDQKWLEISGSFRIEKKPAKVQAYVHGPDAGLDLLVAGLHIFPVDRHARFSHLKQQTEKIRKRDLILKFTSDSWPLVGNSVKIRQTENSFPFGSCINTRDVDNEDFVDFFSKNFNWAVFGNELKWVWMEPRKGELNYKDAEELLNFCISRNIQVRGHCIFEEAESAVQSWVRGLKEDKYELMSAVENRLSDLLTRYNGKLKHYDVNNEMLHGSFYQDHLGKDIRANIFKNAKQLDPSAILFVNDYHVEEGRTCDSRSSLDKYIEHIIDLQEQGAPVGGIGIQGHMNSPVGPIVSSAHDKLRD